MAYLNNQAQIDVLESARARILDHLDTVLNKPRPNYNIDGQSINWADHRKSLLEEIKQIDILIGEAKAKGMSVVVKRGNYKNAWRATHNRSPYV
ncbi:hypothetical protein KAR91_20155 [Candidatus Pacearchaeota archaeon]|nr:hypothetical protein [Candidatus Pacearchaeota archaeon]